MATLYWTDAETARLMVNIAASLAKSVQSSTKIPLFHGQLLGVEPTLNSYDAVKEAIKRVREKTDAVAGYPGDYLKDTVDAFEGLVRFLTKEKDYTFKDAQRDIMGIDFKPIPEAMFTHFYKKVNDRLTELGYTGAPGEKIHKWQNDHLIPDTEVTRVAEQYLEKSRAAAKARVVPYLTMDEAVDDVESVRDMPWSGYSSYTAPYHSKLQFNIDRPWNAPSFANVLTHEGYPGHHVVNCLWEHGFHEGTFPFEGAYYLDSAPNNALFEGVPEVAVRFIGWDDPHVETPELTAAEKADIILAKDIMDLQRLYQTTACYLYHVEHKSKDEVVKYMVDTGWYSPIEAENTTRMFTFSFGAIYYPGYYYGRWLVQKAYDLVPASHRAELFRLLYTMPQTNRTLIDAVRKFPGCADFDPFANL